MGKKRHT
jgi:peptidyl-prolyl cis-trans isomerase-like protein 2